MIISKHHCSASIQRRPLKLPHNFDVRDLFKKRERKYGALLYINNFISLYIQRIFVFEKIRQNTFIMKLL